MREWRVDWYSMGGETRRRDFDNEADAREWFRAVTTGWGLDATATLFRREVDPWEEVDGHGPLVLNHEEARRV